jgi:hypothetical protein
MPLSQVAKLSNFIASKVKIYVHTALLCHHHGLCLHNIPNWIACPTLHLGEIMPYRIKSRIHDLGKYQSELIPELRKMGLVLTTAELSETLRGLRTSKKYTDALSACNEIVSRWESETG